MRDVPDELPQEGPNRGSASLVPRKGGEGKRGAGGGGGGGGDGQSLEASVRILILYLRRNEKLLCSFEPSAYPVSLCVMIMFSH